MPTREELEAALAVLDLEEELVAAKADPKASPATLHDLKQQLRAARAAHRQGRRPAAEPGDAVAAPATIEAKAEVKRP